MTPIPFRGKINNLLKGQTTHYYSVLKINELAIMKRYRGNDIYIIQWKKKSYMEIYRKDRNRIILITVIFLHPLVPRQQIETADLRDLTIHGCQCPDGSRTNFPRMTCI